MRRLAPLLSMSPGLACACEVCRPAVFRLGLSGPYLADLALLFVPLAVSVAGIFFLRWEHRHGDDAD